MEAFKNNDTHFVSLIINEKILFYKNEIEIVYKNILNPELYEAIIDNESKKHSLEAELSFWNELRIGNVSENILNNTLNKDQETETTKLNIALENYISASNSEEKINYNNEMRNLLSRVSVIKSAQKEISKLKK